MKAAKVLPKKILRNYVMFDITHSLEDAVEDSNSLTPVNKDDNKKLGHVVMIGEQVTTVNVGEEVFIPNIPSVQPLMLKLGESTYLLFREADIVAII